MRKDRAHNHIQREIIGVLAVRPVPEPRDQPYACRESEQEILIGRKGDKLSGPFERRACVLPRLTSHRQINACWGNLKKSHSKPPLR